MTVKPFFRRMSYKNHIPFIRFTTTCFLVVFILIAIAGAGDHPWFTNEILWLSVLFAFCVWLISLTKTFFLDIVSVLFTAFFLQRILVIYFRPEQMSYQSYLQFTSGVFQESILFCIASSIAILSGYFCAIFTRKRKKNIPINFDRIFGVKFSFKKLFKVYAVLLFGSFILKLFLMLQFGVGVTALEFSRSYAPILRLTQIILSLSLLPIIVIVSGKFSSKIRKKANLLFVLLILMTIFLDTSKGALLSFCLIFFVCLSLCGKPISKKLIVMGVILFIFTVFILAPVTTLLRTGLIGLVMGSSGPGELLIVATKSYTLVFDRLFFGFLSRLGGFDWLTGFVTVGREAFFPSASFLDDVITIINSLVPGDLIARPADYVTTSKLIPHLLKGWELGTYPGHGELMGGVGMAYLYFGKIGGAIFFFVWSFISVKNLESKSNILIKVLYFQLFIVGLFVAGGFVTIVKIFYEAVALIIFICFVNEIIKILFYPKLQMATSKIN